MTPKDHPIQILCRYRLKPGKEQEFERLLKRHWQSLFELGLASDQPARLLRGSDKAGNVAYIERFAWKSESSIASAHESPEVMQLWEPMGALCEDMEFWEVSALTD
ncbi:MAG: hypothetical protein O7A04_04470 [Acidobacteria bacterium]|nr:hypothetical protein [Acidobacteriota bacterium]